MATSPLGTVLSRLRTLLDPADAETTDRELLARFVARRDDAAFSELVRRHGPMVQSVCRRVLGDAHAAEDAFQAVFLVLVRRARAVPWRESLGGWLHGTARRVALRARGRQGRSLEAVRVALPSNPSDPSEEAAARELRRVLDQELQGLPSQLRAPLVLCDMEGKTHQQAARELGWAKGSLAKRLNGARERLRARLLRRGVALSAGALAAAVTVNEVTATPSAALAAAALLAAHGAASTTASALAQGVIQTMWLTKLKTAAVLLLALTLTATVGGFGAYRAWEARASAVAPAPNPSPPAPEAKETMPIDKAVVYHIGPVQGVQTDALPAGAVIAADRPEDNKGNVLTYLAALEQSKKEKLSVPAGPHLAVFAVGPVLNSGDEAVAVSLMHHGENLTLEMAYSSGEAEGKQYKRNVPWRPLVQVPIELNAGAYHLTVTWQARKSLPAGDAWNVPPTVSTCDFVVTNSRLESKAVRINGAEFTALALSPSPAPETGSGGDLGLDLRITNTSGKPLQFYHALTVTVSEANGKASWTWDSGHDEVKRPDLLTLAPGKSRVLASGAWLEQRPNVVGMRLRAPTGFGGENTIDGLKPGRYLLTIEYASLPKPKDATAAYWEGKATTEPVPFEIVADSGRMHESKAVRVKEVEFRTYVQAQCQAPAAGESLPMDLGLRITNTTDKPLLFKLMDKVWLTLKTADGKELKLDGGRDKTRPYPPVNIGAGQSIDVSRAGRLERPRDGDGLRLGGVDPSGFFWSFNGLHPGKCRLSIRYENADDGKDQAQAYWTGKAATDEVEFEITAP